VHTHTCRQTQKTTVDSINGAHQEELVYLQVSVVLSKVSGPMKGGKSVVVALVDLSPVVQQVVKHIELLISCRKVDGRPGAVILRQKIRVDRHDMKQTLGIPQPD